MENLVYLAAAIPFIAIFIGIAALATARYSLTDTHLRVSLIGLTIRSVAFSDISSAQFFPPDAETARRSLFRHGGTIVVQIKGGRQVAISPRDAEAFYEGLRERLDRPQAGGERDEGRQRRQT